jgi:thioredoxin reductase (NADPH)
LRWGAKSIADDVVKVDFQQHPFTIATHGDEVLRWLRVRNTLTKSVSELPVSGLFYAIGHTPNTQLFQGQLTLDRAGYIQTEGKTTATNIPGVWAAGDVQQR